MAMAGAAVRQITLSVECYVPLYGKTIWKGEVQLPQGQTPADLLAHLGLPGAEMQVLVGGRYAPDDYVLQDRDEVAILRQAEGG